MGIDIQLVACIIPLCGSMRQVWEDPPSDSYDDQARSGDPAVAANSALPFSRGYARSRPEWLLPDVQPVSKVLVEVVWDETSLAYLLHESPVGRISEIESERSAPDT